MLIPIESICHELGEPALVECDAGYPRGRDADAPLKRPDR